MSRSNYHDDVCYDWSYIRWRGAVRSGVCSKRGQAFLRNLIDHLDAMPVKYLCSGSFKNDSGEICTLTLPLLEAGISDPIDLQSLLDDVECGDTKKIQRALSISDALIREIMYQNDEGGPYDGETGEQRWVRMRAWVAEMIRSTS